MKAFVIGDDNIVRNDATGVVLINCNGYEATSDDNDKTIFANGSCVIDENGVVTATISVTSKTQTASFMAGQDAYNVYEIDASSGNITVTLEVGHSVIWFVRADATANTVDLVPSGGNTINGAVSYPLNVQYEKVHVLRIGNNFYV